ncbi:MAG: toxin-related Ca2+-binding protein [Chitinophagaceae bacterium]|nr:toxin-related Ca2+-binding protein [Chitinophagaceae bacterium]MDB5223977.1 toxin-related Ca2+-binding protein [Chitinophagaceae bacterium]
MKNPILIFLLSAFLFSCKKSPESIDNNFIVSIPIPLATPVTGSVAGNVVDENNNPVANAQVTVSGSIYTTDSKGSFNTTNVSLDKYISTVTVNKQGYFKAIRSFAANVTKNYVSIKLIPKILTGTFASSASGSVSLSNSSQISFTANSINIKSSGAAYNGTVNVYASYIDPTSSDIGARVPGSFIGEDATQIYYLQSTGMIAVELESATGESLQLASGKPATIKLAIPTSLQTKAPATIDTWSLNDKGIWIKEGTATKNGTFYEMQVSHFSFWNCDSPTKTVYVNLNIKDQNNHILPNTWIQLSPNNNTYWGTTYGLTDSLGNVSGLVPANESLQLIILSGIYICSNTLSTQTVGPFSASTNLNVIATINPQQILTINGSVNNCSGAPVTSGTVFIYLESKSFFTSVVNGNFSVSITHCGALPLPIQVLAVDNATLQQSSISAINANQDNINVGVIVSCATTNKPFLNYTVDGINYITDTLVAGYIIGQQIKIYGRTTDFSKSLQFVTNGIVPGTFTSRIDSLNTTYSYPTMLSNASATFTVVGAAGQFIEGSFNLPFTKNNVSHTCTGTFRARRY